MMRKGSLNNPAAMMGMLGRMPNMPPSGMGNYGR